MARYPEIPSMFFAKKTGSQTYTQEEVYSLLRQWGAALISELDLRDIEVEAAPTSNVLAVVTVTEVGRPQAGDIVYAASAGKFRGFVSVATTAAWYDLGGVP
jgi:hypothetical protein|tara:strand:+ start:687 stop:992 length:306 start_codon:yes stop_codon:yes gene_type:complete